MDYFIDINNYILKLFSDFIINNDLEKIIGLFADIPIFFLPLFLIFSWFYFTFFQININKKKDLILIFIGVSISISVNLVLQQFFYESRPITFVEVILNHIPNNSFPSDHATVSVAFLTGLFLAWYKKTFYIFLPFVIIMNISRIAWWIHWFFDIIAWVIIWFISGVIVFKYLKINTRIDKLTILIIKFFNSLKL